MKRWLLAMAAVASGIVLGYCAGLPPDWAWLVGVIFGIVVAMGAREGSA